MSHFSAVKVNIEDADCVEEALKNMGLKYTRTAGKFQVTSSGESGMSTYHGITIDVAKGNTSVGSDWYYQQGEFKEKAFVARLTQQYGVSKVKKEVVKRGYHLMGNTTETDGSIKLTCRRFS